MERIGTRTGGEMIGQSMVFVMAASVFLGIPGLAHSQVFASTVDSTSAAAGARDGRVAAGRPSVAGRFAAGFAGGLPLGFFILPAAFGRSGALAIPVAAGFGVVAGAVASGSTDPPPPVADSAAARGSAYELAFWKAYATQLHGRRASAGLLGGVTGVVGGIGLLVLLLSNLKLD